MDVEVPPAWGVGGFTPIFPPKLNSGVIGLPPQKEKNGVADAHQGKRVT